MTKEEFRQLNVGQSVFAVNLSMGKVDEVVITETYPAMGAGYPAMISAKDKDGFSRMYVRKEVSLSLKSAWAEIRDNAKEAILDLEDQIKYATRKIAELRDLLEVALAESGKEETK
ncbi:MAG: hypothetical protein IKW49_01615 [Opitutales bacterium]|nr:hypothetical protein [Opitutales bacterium]